MDLSFEAFKSEYEKSTKTALNGLLNEFSEVYLMWKQTKLLEILNEKIDKLRVGGKAK